MGSSLQVRLATLRATLRLLHASQPRAFVVSAVASLAEPLFFPAFLLVLQLTLQQAAASPTGALQATPALGRLGLALVALIITQRLGIIVHDGSSTILRQEAWVTMSRQILAKLPAVPYPLFENNAFQARYGLVIREAAFRSITLVDSLLSTAPIFFGIVGLALTVLSLAPVLVLVMAVIAVPASHIERRFSDAMYELQEHSAPDKLRMEALTNMQVDATWQRDLRVYRSDILSREHTSLAEKYLANLKGLTLKFVRLRSAAAIVEALGIALALTAAYVLIGRGQLSLPKLAVLIPGLALLFGMVQSLIYHVRSLIESLNYAATLFEFLNRESFADLGAEARAPVMSAGPRQPLHAIRLRDVGYTYPEQQKTALIAITCELRPGLTAVVGTNGAGKSTLVKLLTGLIPPTTGSLQAELPGGELVPLATCVKAVLFQDPSHFPFSIRQNVTMAAEPARNDEARIEQALQLAGLWEAVAALPDGIETVVGSGFGGVTDLSGGQWQRLALARLLYHDSPLIILDEPTASLDPVGERQIFNLLATFAKEKIIVFATHRYDTIRKADMILVLLDGRLAEMGTHEQLAANTREYWSLFLAQGSSTGR